MKEHVANRLVIEALAWTTRNRAVRDRRVRRSAVAKLLPTLTAALALQVGQGSFGQTKIVIQTDPNTTAGLSQYYDDYGATDEFRTLDANFDPENDGTFDEEAVRTWIESSGIPEDYDGLLMIDWEGFWNCILSVGPGGTCDEGAPGGDGVEVTQQMYEDARAAGVAFLQFVTDPVEELLPYAKVGFYSVPFAVYDAEEVYEGDPCDDWVVEDRWLDRNPPLQSIVDASGALFPSLTDVRRNPEDSLECRDLFLVHENVRLFLQYFGDKPIYPVVHHRWVVSQEGCASEIHGRLIDSSEFEVHMAEVFETHDGDAVDGVLWWVPDQGIHDSTGYCAHWAEEIFSEEMAAHPFVAEPTYPDDYVDWEFHRNSLLLDRLVRLSNIAYGTDRQLPVVVEPGLVSDGYITSRYPTSNFNGYDLLLGAGPGYAHRPLLDCTNLNWAGAPAGSTVAFSVLMPNCVSAAGIAAPFSCHPMTQQSWLESQATWYVAQSGLNWSTPGGDFQASNGVSSGLTLPNSTGLHSYDITPTLQWSLDNLSGVLNITFKLDSETGTVATAFDSAESGIQPWLWFTVIPPEE